MFLKFALALVMSALVPILGLTSCSKDRTDDWSLSEPTLTASAFSIPVSKAGRTQLPFETELVFNSSWSSLQVVSSCRLNSVSYRETFLLNFRSSVDLKSLWPRELTARSSNKELTMSECDFAFTASSAEGSTHEFQLNGIKLARFIRSGEPLFRRASTNDSKSAQLPVSIRSDLDLLSSVASDLVEPLKGDIELTLVCGDQRATTRLAASPAESVQTLLAHLKLVGDHACHFMAFQASSDTNRFSLSDEANLRFSSPPIEVLAQSPYASAGANLTADRLEIQRITLSNNNPETVLVKFPQAATNLRLRFAQESDESVTLSPIELKYRLSLKRNGGVLIGRDVVSVAPHTQVIFSFVVAPDDPVHCLIAPDLDGGAIVGFQFGFDADAIFQQIEKTNDVSGVVVYRAPKTSESDALPESLVFEQMVPRYGATLPDWVTTRAQPKNACL